MTNGNGHCPLRATGTVIFFLSAAIFVSGCSPSAQPKSDIVAYVNKEPITAKDLERELILRARQDPTFQLTPQSESAQLDSIINRKLIIQEAIAKGLAGEERFVNTIKSFWEQTLVRDFFEFKQREFRENLFANDNEIKKFYDALSHTVVFRVFQTADKQAADSAYGEYTQASNANATGWVTIGPVGYDDIRDTALRQAFDDAVGVPRKVGSAGQFYVVVVTEKVPIEIRPLEAIRADVEKKVIDEKERRLFDQWLADKRSQSRIQFTPRGERYRKQGI